MTTSTDRFTYKGARNLIIGDRLESASGKILTVTSVMPRLTRTVVLFDGDLEIDFDPYCQLKVFSPKLP